jgi:hypothetical protein
MRRLARRFDTIGTCSPNCLIERFQLSNHEHALSFRGETGGRSQGWSRACNDKHKVEPMIGFHQSRYGSLTC